MVVEKTIRTFISDGYEAGVRELEPIAGEIWPGFARRGRRRPRQAATAGAEVPGKRPAFRRRIAAATYVRDHFQCVYCTARVMPLGLLSTLAGVYPEQIPYHVNYKSGSTHPMFWTRTSEADHKDAGSRGGDWSDINNHVTACVLCNTRKGDRSLEEMNWQVRPAESSSDWNGLVDLYRPLWEAAGKPTGYRREWLIALDEVAL